MVLLNITMNIKSIQEYILKIQNQANQYRQQAKSLEQKAIFIEKEIPGLRKALELLHSKTNCISTIIQDNKPKQNDSRIILKRQKPSCRGNVRIIYKLMKKENRPISAIELHRATNINQNTISGTLRVAYNTKGFIDKVGDGLYQINEKGLELLEITKDDDKRDIQ